MKKQTIYTEKAPKAIGPYSQGIKVGDLLFTSGQVPFIPETGEIVADDIQTQTRQALQNVQAIVEEAGLTMEDVVKTTVFLQDMNDFALMNEVYETFFSTNKPARSAVQVARLPRDVKIEIEAIATYIK